MSRNLTVTAFVTALWLLTVSFTAAASTHQHTDTLRVNIAFRQNVCTFEPGYMDNAVLLRDFAEKFRGHACEQRRVQVNGYASPEGPTANNLRLARERANVISRYLQEECGIPAHLISQSVVPENYEDLYKEVLADANVPMRQSVLEIIRTVPDTILDVQGRWTGGRKQQLMNLGRGEPWRYMLKNIYPRLRGANAEILCTVTYEVPDPVPEPPEPEVTVVETDTLQVAEPAPVPLPEPLCANRYWSLHTNMLYDALAIPNLGVEAYLGKNFSLAANWWYAWWKSDTVHRYWRTYGGYLAGRWWFGRAAHAKPLTGHHIGVYAQMMLYDFEWGGRGYLSGTPGRNIFRHPTWGGGIEYGFALPVASRLNIDFTIGLGYLQGLYWEYEPADDHYIWLSHKMRRWFGPTKIEVSLVYLLGHGNRNEKRGGKP